MKETLKVIKTLCIKWDKYSLIDAQESEAVSYVIQLNNETSNPMQVQFDLKGVTGIDDMGIQYIDESFRVDTFGNQVYPYNFSILPQSSKVFTFGLGRKDWYQTTGAAFAYYVKTRVDLRTNYLDFTWDKITYRTDAFHQLENISWRLPRN